MEATSVASKATVVVSEVHAEGSASGRLASTAFTSASNEENEVVVTACAHACDKAKAGPVAGPASVGAVSAVTTAEMRPITVVVTNTAASRRQRTRTLEVAGSMGPATVPSVSIPFSCKKSRKQKADQSRLGRHFVAGAVVQVDVQRAVAGTRVGTPSCLPSGGPLSELEAAGIKVDPLGGLRSSVSEVLEALEATTEGAGTVYAITVAFAIASVSLGRAAAPTTAPGNGSEVGFVAVAIAPSNGQNAVLEVAGSVAAAPNCTGLVVAMATTVEVEAPRASSQAEGSGCGAPLEPTEPAAQEAQGLPP